MKHESNVQPVEQTSEKPVCKLDKFFGVTKAGSTIRTEIVAGIVTFLAMAYILTVNPNQFFYAGTSDPRWASVFMATAFGAIIGTLLMAFLAKLPLAQASGMGLNSMVGTVIGGGVGAFSTYVFEFTLANAMLMVLISGVVFLLLSVISIKGVSLRQKLFEGIPAGTKTAIPVGIGLFIAYIGMQNAGFIVTNGYTQVGMITFSKWELQTINWAAGTQTTPATAIVMLIGLVSIAILSHLKVKGAVIIGILVATLVGIPFGVTNLEVVAGKVDGITWKFWENFETFFTGEVFLAPFKGGFDFPEGSLFTIIMIIISMSMIDMFDTMGTCVGCCSAAGLLDENGTPRNYAQIMYADSIATCTGALLGTSTVTTFVESGSGIAEGGKTGLTALSTAVMFFLAIFALPLFAMIPSAATASALVYVGVLMMKNIKNVDFSDIRIAVPAFLAIALMPLAYSITTGIGMAILSYVVISILCFVCELVRYAITKKEEHKPVWNVSVVTIIISLLFCVYFFVPVTL